MKFVLSLYFILFFFSSNAQNYVDIKLSPTRQDTLRGSITKERAWWDVLHYDLTVQPYLDTRSIKGSNIITYKVLSANAATDMQIDLQPPLVIDSILLDNKTNVSFVRDGNVWYAKVHGQAKGEEHKLTVHYSGKPLEAYDPPGDGGLTWGKDSLGRPWIVTSCQGIGASVWYPCKDHQSDEPDRGAMITVRVPDTLVAVSNGRLLIKWQYPDDTRAYRWQVNNTINNYDICFYVGKYTNIAREYKGIIGTLTMDFWVLDYNEKKAEEHLIPNAIRTLNCYEKWMGPYPFYTDGFKMVDVPYIGMEHQSAVAYGNRYKYGYRGKDISKTGWGMKYDILIVHEVAHEWFGNSITTSDLAEKWVHEGFTGYAEILYLNDLVGKDAANEYLIAKRAYIKNEIPVIPRYNINEMNGADDYSKGRAVVHMIRQIINNDEQFRQLLLNINKQFRHKIITSSQLEAYISQYTRIDFSKFFDQYLRTANLPTFEYRIEGGIFKYRYVNCVAGFNMPLKVTIKKEHWLVPTTQWQEMTIQGLSEVDAVEVDPNFYIEVKK